MVLFQLQNNVRMQLRQMTNVEFNTEALTETQLEKGLTDSELASAMGITERTLHNWRSGYSRPSWNRIVRAARALGVEPKSLVVQPMETPA